MSISPCITYLLSFHRIKNVKRFFTRKFKLRIVSYVDRIRFRCILVLVGIRFGACLASLSCAFSGKCFNIMITYSSLQLRKSSLTSNSSTS